MNGRPCRLARGTARLALAACVAAIAAACTSTPDELPPRSKLNRYELQSMRPEMQRHAECLARETAASASSASSSASSASSAASASPAAVERAVAACESSLGPLRARLRAFNLTDAAQRRYLGALEIASRRIVSDQLAGSRQSVVVE
jgi:hypothetical protein